MNFIWIIWYDGNRTYFMEFWIFKLFLIISMLNVGKASWTSEFPNFQIFPTMDIFQLTWFSGQFINATECQKSRIHRQETWMIEPDEITEPDWIGMITRNICRLFFSGPVRNSSSKLHDPRTGLWTDYLCPKITKWT